MRLNHAQTNANKLGNAERHGPSDGVCNKYTINPYRPMRHLASVGHFTFLRMMFWGGPKRSQGYR